LLTNSFNYYFMFEQNFFFVTVGTVIVVMAIFYIILAIIAIVLVWRLARFSRGLNNLAERGKQLLDRIEEKIKYSAFIALFTRGLEEVISYVKEKKKEKKGKEE